MINMGYIIAGLKVVKFFERQCLGTGKLFFEMEFMVTFEDLVISVTGNFMIMIHKTLVHRKRNGVEIKLPPYSLVGQNIIKDRIEAFELVRVFGEDIILDSFFRVFCKIADQDIKILIKTGLRRNVIFKNLCFRKVRLRAKFNRCKTQHIPLKSVCIDVKFIRCEFDFQIFFICCSLFRTIVFKTDPVDGKSKIIKPKQSIFRNKRQNRLPLFHDAPILNIWYNRNMVQLVNG